MTSDIDLAAGPSLRLAAPNPGEGRCKICDGVSRLFGVTDFNRSCEELRGKFLPLRGVPVYYRRCERCGLLFTEAFDDWAQSDFEAHIYNDGYAEVDPDYAETRPTGSAGLVRQGFGAHAADLSVLDYGGGNGRFAEELRRAGFPTVETYDPFHPDHRERPGRRFKLITCFETLEHMPDPVAGAADIASFLEDDGLVLMGTLTQPQDFDKLRMQWWYIGPRNGHVTLHTKASLTGLWSRFGLEFGSFNENIHVAFRTIPSFAAHLIKPKA